MIQSDPWSVRLCLSFAGVLERLEQTKKRHSRLAFSCNTRYKVFVIKKIYECKGWSVAGTILRDFKLYVNLVIDQRYKFYCTKCHTRLWMHAARKVKVKDLPASGYPVYIEAEVFHSHCPHCGAYHTLRPSTFHASMPYTLRFMREISRLMRRAPARQIARDYGIATSSALRIDRWVLNEEMPEPCMDNVEGIIIDEKYLGDTFGFVTLVLNARTGEPLFLGRGKDGGCLREFFASLTEDQRKAILYLGIDRSNTFRAVARQYLPHVKICYDPYHLVSNMNDVVVKVRKHEVDEHRDEAFKKVVKGTRYLLLVARQKLDAPGRLRLDHLFAANRNLNTAYMLKEQFRAIFQQRDENAATWSLIEWIRMAMASKVPLIKNFARGIRDKFNDIINSFRYHINSARIEAMNADINRVQARCCGLFDLRYLFLKLRQFYFLRSILFYVKPRRVLQQN